MSLANSRFEFFVASRYLRAKRKQAVISIISVISVVGVAAGVMALVIALAINNGFRNTLQRSLLGAYADINVLEKEPNGIEDWRERIARLKKLPHVVAASPNLIDKVYIYGSASSDGVILKGIDPDAEVQVSEMLRKLKYGAVKNLKADTGFPGIVLGTSLAASIGAKMNGIVYISGRELTPLGPRSREYKYRVVGMFETGFYEIDSALVMISLDAAQKMMSVGDVVNSIELKLDDVYRATEVARAVDKAVGPALAASTWMEQNKHILNALNMEKIVTWVTIGLIVLVAALNILITLVMMVMEKFRDIAILVSMGARAAQIRRIFQVQGVLIGAVGTALGLAAGHTLCYFADKHRWVRLDEEVYALSWVPFEPRWLDSLWIAAVAILISFLATLYPARNASRIAPAEALRYE